MRRCQGRERRPRRSPDRLLQLPFAPEGSHQKAASLNPLSQSIITLKFGRSLSWPWTFSAQHLFDRQPDCGEELPQLRRFLDVANGAHQTRTVLIAVCLRRSDNRYRHIGEARILSQFSEDFKAIASGRVQIEENGIRVEPVFPCRVRTKRIHGRLAIFEARQLVEYAVLLQGQFNQKYVCRIVFDQDDLSCVHPSPPLRRNRKVECRSLPICRFSPNPAPVTPYDSLTDSQTEPAAGKLLRCVQAFKGGKDLFQVLGLDADTVVSQRNGPDVRIPLGRNVDTRRLARSSIFQCVADDVLE